MTLDDGNPFGITLALKLVGAIARIMRKAGVLEYLEEKAKHTDTELDDFAIRIARTLIDEATEL